MGHAWTVTFQPELGAVVRLYDSTGDDIGLLHMPTPVTPGDLAADRGAIFRLPIRTGTAADLDSADT